MNPLPETTKTPRAQRFQEREAGSGGETASRNRLWHLRDVVLIVFSVLSASLRLNSALCVAAAEGVKTSFKFDFGLVTVVEEVARVGDDPLRGDFVTSSNLFKFSVAVPTWMDCTRTEGARFPLKWRH